MDTHVAGGVPRSQSLPWSQMARAADKAGDSRRNCTQSMQGQQQSVTKAGKVHRESKRCTAATSAADEAGDSRRNCTQSMQGQQQ
jgi:hypothetical protein